MAKQVVNGGRISRSSTRIIDGGAQALLRSKEIAVTLDFGHYEGTRALGVVLTKLFALAVNKDFLVNEQEAHQKCSTAISALTNSDWHDPALSLAEKFIVLVSQKMETDEPTAARLEAMKDFYNDPPRDTVKTVITETGDVVDFNKINEQPFFNHPLCPKDYKVEMEPSSPPRHEYDVPPVSYFPLPEKALQGTIPIYRTRKGAERFRKTCPPWLRK
ncbi:hypothetical protein Ancab_012366 [Ancistrocladus abbreviatus]